MPLLFAGIAVIHAVWALRDVEKLGGMKHPAVKARLRVAAVMMLISLFLFFYL